jgi:hypothetical protein
MSPEVIARAVDHWKSYKWHLKHAKESAIPLEHLERGQAQKNLSVHMLQSPHLYVRRFGKIDWQIYQEAMNGQA